MRRLLFYCKLTLSSIAGRVQKHFLGRNTFAIISHTDNGLFATNPEDMGVGKVLRKFGSYGNDEVERVFKYVGKNDNVLIIGAHIGALVVPIAKRCRNVVAIEANPDTFALLKINLSLNGLNNVRAYNIAASDKAETIDFVSSRNNSGGAKRMPKVRAFEYFYDLPETISVQAFALDEHLKGEQFSLVFMDIEGSEYFALSGMPNILRNARTLFVEYLPHHLRNVSGISPKDFVRLIEPYFETLLVPSKDIQVDKSNFLSTLQSMFDNEQGDDGLVFAK